MMCGIISEEDLDGKIIKSNAEGIKSIMKYEIEVCTKEGDSNTDKGYRNAIEVLTTTIGIEHRDDRWIVLKDLDEVFEIINASDTICYVKHLIDENNNIKSLEVGENLNDKFHRRWQRSSKMRYGNALLSWSKFLRQKFNN